MRSFGNSAGSAACGVAAATDPAAPTVRRNDRLSMTPGV